MQVMKKYIQLLKYIFWGGMSTGINLVILFLLLYFTDVHYLIANTVAYFIAVIVNYVFNKRYVFYSSKDTKKELLSFMLMRLVSLLIDNVLYYIAVDIINCNVYISRLVVSAVIILGTYFINKYLIFKGKNI